MILKRPPVAGDIFRGRPPTARIPRDVEVERAFKRAIATGLSDLREGREVSLGDAKIRLGLLLTCIVEMRIAESALVDLEDIRSWYGEQGAPDAGARLVAEVIARIECLENHPDIGRTVPEFGRDDLKEIIYPPFRIVYQREPFCGEDRACLARRTSTPSDRKRTGHAAIVETICFGGSSPVSRRLCRSLSEFWPYRTRRSWFTHVSWFSRTSFAISGTAPGNILLDSASSTSRSRERYG